MRMCTGRIGEDDEAVPCPYPPVVPQSPYCHWHRLLRTTFNGQTHAAEMRRASAPGPYRPRVPAGDWPPGERWCSQCQSMIPLFYCTGSRCKACARESAATARRQTVYGLSDQIWKAIMVLQDGLCAVCRNRQRDRSPAAEHNHSTGVVRGGACVNCNHKLLGGAHDSPRLLAAALIYLLAPPTSGRWVKPEDGAADAVLRVVAEELDRLYLVDVERGRADVVLAALGMDVGEAE